MDDKKYIGLDVHPATISIAVLDVAGKLNDQQKAYSSKVAWAVGSGLRR